MRNTKSKYYVFTINHPTFKDFCVLGLLLSDIGTVCSYIVYGEETSESGTPHLQGYAEFVNRVETNRACKLLGGRANCNPRRGTSIEASSYCKKDAGSIWEGGSLSIGQGTRSDLESIRSQIISGATLLQIATEHFSKYCIYRNAFAAYKDLLSPPCFRLDLKVYYLWGEAGCGKTRFAFEHGNSPWISNDPELKWFDGYGGESNAVLDDYRGGATDSLILRLLDIYPLQVAIKGGFRAWNVRTIWITSNLPPDRVHESVQSPFRRRIAKVWHFSGPLDFESETAMARVRAGLGLPEPSCPETSEEII